MKRRFRVEKGKKDWRAFLGDQEISEFVHRVFISLEAGGLPEVHLILSATDVDIPEDLEAIITAERPDDNQTSEYLSRVIAGANNGNG